MDPAVDHSVVKDRAPWLQRLRSDPRRLWARDMLLPAAAIMGPVSILASVAWLNWTTTWTTAEADMRQAALSAAEYSQRAFEGYIVAVGRVNDRLRDLTDQQIRDREQELGQDLQRITGELSQSQLSYVIDREGVPLVVTNIFPAPAGSLADRDYFQALSQTDAPDLFISETFVGRFDGQQLFSISRRRTDTGNPPTADGFDGVVLISVSPRVLARGLERLLLQPTDLMALVRADGAGISSTSGVVDENQPLPKVDADSPFYDHAARGDRAAVYMSGTAMSGTNALLAIQAIGDLPLYAVAVRPVSQIVASWRATMLPMLAIGLPATLALFLLSLRVALNQRQLTQRNVILQRDNALNSDRLVRAKRFGLMGTFEFDLRSGVSRRSADYMSIHGHDPVPAEEAHEDWAQRVHPDDRARAEHEVLRVLSDESGETEYGQTYRIVTAQGDTRWIAARGEIDRDEAGRAVLLRGIHVDVTPLRNTEMALAESDARLRLAQEAMGIGAWEWRGQSEPMQCSRKALELFGFDPASGPVHLRDVLARIHCDDRVLMARGLRQMRESGSFQAEVRLQRAATAAEDSQVWVSLRGRTITSRRLGGARLMGVVYDISDRKRSEELVVLMAHEVEHRAKNALTVVASLLRTAKADSAEELARVMGGRVRALGQTMALLGKERWTGATLRDIVEGELKPFFKDDTGTDDHITIVGPPVRIGVEAAQPLSMALHELATNAAKYGALSVVGGTLAVSWKREGAEIHIRWHERGGPAITTPPAAKGFGSRLISIVFEGQIAGRIERRWDNDGLICDMVLPASSLSPTSVEPHPTAEEGPQADRNGSA